jgi:hypothetical protein
MCLGFDTSNGSRFCALGTRREKDNRKRKQKNHCHERPYWGSWRFKILIFETAEIPTDYSGLHRNFTAGGPLNR